MARSFMDYLSEYEKKIEDISKPKEVVLVVEKETPKVAVRSNPTRNAVTQQNAGNGKLLGNSFSICTACGTKQPIIVEGIFCPSCGSQSLINSTGLKSAKQVVEQKKDLRGTLSHAEALLDDEAVVTEEYISPLQKLVKQKKEVPLEERHQMVDHASDLLGDDDTPAPSMNFIPMPDFSSLKNRQPAPIVENKVIDPSLQLISVPPMTVDPETENQMRSLGLL